MIVSVSSVVVVLVVVSMRVIVLVDCKTGEATMPADITTAARTMAIANLGYFALTPATSIAIFDVFEKSTVPIYLRLSQGSILILFVTANRG